MIGSHVLRAMLDITVIIPTYNRAHCLPRAIGSVLQQTHQATSIIVIDDGSIDDTEDLVRTRYPSVHYLKKTNSGVSAARNLGIQQVQTEWVALLDSDDEWLPTKLDKQMRLLSQNPTFNICHTEEIWVRNGVRVNQMKKHKKSGGWIFEQCLPQCAMSPSSVVMAAALFSEVGLFREDLPACEDYDLWLKICATYPVLFIEEPCIIKYGGHEDQLSSKYWGMDRFRIKSLLDLLEHQVLDEKKMALAKLMVIKKIKIYLKGAIKRGKADEVKAYQTILSRLSLMSVNDI